MGMVCGFIIFMKKTLVTGASENPARYSNKAIRLLREYGYDVAALGRREGRVLDVDILTGKPLFDGVDTITMYLSAANQHSLEDYFIGLKPRRIIFNPGATNPSLEHKASKAGIEVIYECTLVLLRLEAY